HRRRAADRRDRRAGCQAAERLLLRPDAPDLECPRRSRRLEPPARLRRGRRRAARPRPHGTAAVSAGLMRRSPATLLALFPAPAVLAGAALPFLLLGRGLAVGGGVWLLLAGALVALWRVLALLSRGDGPARHLLVPALFGAAVLYLWEVLVRGLDVPLILLPP